MAAACIWDSFYLETYIARQGFEVSSMQCSLLVPKTADEIRIAIFRSLSKESKWTNL
jgi:hypothetical protein